MPMPIAAGNRYNFVSPGAMIGDQMSDFLAQRELENQRDLENQRAAQELALKQEQEKRLAEYQKAEAENLTENTASLKAQREAAANAAEQKSIMGVLAGGGVGSEVSPDIVARANKVGLSPSLFGTQVAQGAQTGTDENGVPQYETSKKTVYAGTPEEKAMQEFLNDPKVPDNAKAYVKATGDMKGAEKLLEKPETEDVFYQDPRTKKVLRRNPATNQFEEYTGEVPKGAHWMTEPNPLTTPNQSFNENNASYQYHMTALDKIEAPLSQSLTNYANLSDAVMQKTPQADTIVAPEALKLLVGGNGSGFRMTMGEIQGFTGGRSGWQDLIAKIQHWNPNSGDALPITDTQRKQIQNLMKAGYGRLQSKIDAVDEASGTIANSFDNPAAHRAAYDKMKKKIHDIDFGAINESAGGGSKKTADQLRQQYGY